MTKDELRTWIKEERKKLNIEKLSKLIVQKVTDSEEYKKARNILIYYPMKYEINLLTLLKDSSKNFFLPKIDKDNLLCCPYKAGDETCLSCFKTCEPLTEPCEKDLIDTVFVPSLAIDKDGFRLGYGGGFYDRFLKDFKGEKITCIYSGFIVESVFPENYDIRLNKILTEKDYFKFNK